MVKLWLFEAQHGPGTGNYGKFAVGRPGEEEWSWRSYVTGSERPLLRDIGWGPKHLWVFDLQTGEGAFFLPGGHARNDLEKHRIWVCPLFEPFLEWLWKQDCSELGALHAASPVVVLPRAEFAFSGYRRQGPLEALQDELEQLHQKADWLEIAIKKRIAEDGP